MKYILEENIRHVLSERFILNEAEGEDTFDNSVLTDIKSLSTKVYDYIKHHSEKENETKNTETLSKLKTEVSTLNTLIQKNKDMSMVKAEVTEAVSKIEKIIQLADPPFNIMGEDIPDEYKSKGVDAAKVQDLFNSIKSTAYSSTIDKNTIADLKRYVNLFTQIVSSFNVTSQKNSTDNKINIKDCDDLYLNLDKLLDFYTKTKKTGEMFTTLNNQIKETITIHDAWRNNKTDDNLTKMFKAFSVLNNNITKVLTSENFDGDPAKKTGFRNIDWAKRYEDAVDKNDFWDEYYKQVWGSNADRIRALGNAFRVECEHFGFSSKTNPFISFIQRYIIDKNYIIDKGPYEVLHNAIANGKLKVSNLTSTTDPINIVYCKDFYNQDPEVMKSYLDILVQIKQLRLTNIFKPDFADSITEPERKTAFINLISYFNKTDYTYPQIIWVILFDNITTANLLEKKSESGGGVVLPDLTTFEGTKLRRIQDARALLAVLEPETAESSAKSFDDASLMSLFDKIPTDTVENAGKWIVTMITTFLLPKDAEGIYKQFPNLTKISVTGEEAYKIKAELFTLGNAMKKSQIENILVGLEKLDGKNIRFRENKEAK